MITRTRAEVKAVADRLYYHGTTTVSDEYQLSNAWYCESIHDNQKS